MKGVLQLETNVLSAEMARSNPALRRQHSCKIYICFRTYMSFKVKISIPSHEFLKTPRRPITPIDNHQSGLVNWLCSNHSSIPRANYHDCLGTLISMHFVRLSPRSLIQPARKVPRTPLPLMRPGEEHDDVPQIIFVLHVTVRVPTANISLGYTPLGLHY
ncbi:hypothetical protein OG21DRAFT_277855 [Imleria badia]|nr:hypothetical protein OG21DRAFT_277855 [Imleria badia]